MVRVKTPSGWKTVKPGKSIGNVSVPDSSGSSGGDSSSSGSGQLPGYSNPTKSDGSAIDWDAVEKRKSSGGSSVPVQLTQAQTNKVITDYQTGKLTQAEAPIESEIRFFLYK